jgi:hypothetical protein
VNKVWPLLAVVAAAVVAVLVLDPFAKTAVDSDDAAGRAEPAAPTPPSLVNAPGGRRYPNEVQPAGDAPDAPPDATASTDAPTITGVVLDDETGKPVVGAFVMAEPAGANCPRLPADAAFVLDELGFWMRRAGTNMGRAHPRVGQEPDPRAPRPRPDAALSVTGQDGAFRLDFPERADLFVRARGYVLGSHCSASPAASVTVRLGRGLAIRGMTVRADGRPVGDASITVRPGPGTPALPGHLEGTTSDKEGAFTVTGLLPGAVVVTADHPKYVPTSLPALEPGGAPVKVVLVPALVARFAIRTDTGTPPENPSLAWSTTSQPPKSGLLLLGRLPEPMRAEDAPDPPPTFGPVKVPCDAREARFEVKAVGYEAWTSPPEPLPPEGGEKTFDVLLNRDLTLGSLRVFLEDADGTALSWAGERARAEVGRRDTRDIPGGVIHQPGETLLLPALPAGPYVVVVRSPGHAPAVFETEVVAGADAERRVVLGPPAKLRVRFTSADAVLVRFEVHGNGQSILAFPERTTTVAESEDDAGAPVYHAGADGLVLSGLGAGKHTVRVVSPDLTAPPTDVDLAIGETRDVEIAVTRR